MLFSVVLPTVLALLIPTAATSKPPNTSLVLKAHGDPQCVKNLNGSYPNDYSETGVFPKYQTWPSPKFPGAEPLVGIGVGGYNVWWSVENLDVGCRLLIMLPYTQGVGQMLQAPGNQVINTRRNGCYYSSIPGAQDVLTSLVCNATDIINVDLDTSEFADGAADTGVSDTSMVSVSTVTGNSGNSGSATYVPTTMVTSSAAMTTADASTGSANSTEAGLSGTASGSSNFGPYSTRLLSSTDTQTIAAAASANPESASSYAMGSSPASNEYSTSAMSSSTSSAKSSSPSAKQYSVMTSLITMSEDPSSTSEASSSSSPATYAASSSSASKTTLATYLSSASPSATDVYSYPTSTPPDSQSSSDVGPSSSGAASGPSQQSPAQAAPPNFTGKPPLKMMKRAIGAVKALAKRYYYPAKQAPSTEPPKCIATLGKEYTRAGLQTAVSSVITCTFGYCNVGVAHSVAYATALTSVTTQTLTNTQGMSMSVSAGMDMLVEKSSITVGLDTSIANGFSQATQTQLQTTNTSTVTTTLSAMLGTKGLMTFTPTYRCWKGPVDCGAGVSEPLEFCQPVLDSLSNLSGDFMVVEVG